LNSAVSISRVAIAATLVAAVLLSLAGAIYLLRPPHYKRHPPGIIVLSGRPVDLYPVDPARQKLSLYWRDDTGNPFESLERLDAWWTAQGLQLDFAVNSGIFMDSPQGPRPLGLHIEEGKELVPLNTQQEGYGNFYMQPNGVFWWNKEEAGILSTKDYRNAGVSPEFALQSGPMLLVDGGINPAFAKDSRNVKLRAGVGLTTEGTVLLGVSSKPVSLHDFASALLNSGCRQALYLDGAITGLHAPRHGVRHHGGMAGMLAVLDRPAEGAIAP